MQTPSPLPPDPIEVTDRQAVMLRRFVQFASSHPVLADQSAAQTADWDEAASIILRLAGADQEAEQARHAAAVIREANEQQLVLWELLNNL